MNAQPSLIRDDADLPVGGMMPHVNQIRGLVALTTDALLIRALQDLASSGLNVSVVSDMRSLTDLLLQNVGDVTLIDAAALDTPAAEVVDMISRQLPDLRIMVAGQSADQQQLGSRLTNKTVFRFVHKPASMARLKLLLDSAARPAEAVVTASVAVEAPKPHAMAPGGGIPHKFIAIGAAALAVVALTAWLLWPKNSGTPAIALPPPAAVPATNPVDDIAALLAKADAAFTASKFVASDGSSAAERYRAALKIDATNSRAREGYDKSIDQALRRAEQSLLASKLNDASNIAAAVGLIAPDNPRLGFLNTQISREQARINTDASQRQAFEATQAKIKASLATMKERMQRGALVDPVAGSAVASFREAEAAGANDPAVRAARESLIAALLTAADSDLTARRTTSGRKLVDAARAINSNAPGVDVMVRRVEEATRPVAPEPANPPQRNESLASGASEESPPPPAVTPATKSPESASATPASTVPSNPKAVVSANTLRALHREQPVYPDWALQQLISGWVDLEFTVAPNGTVKDIVIVNAEPKNTFNSAAKVALSRYRYEPVMRDGVAVSQRSSMRIRFTAKDSP